MRQYTRVHIFIRSVLQIMWSDNLTQIFKRKTNRYYIIHKNTLLIGNILIKTPLKE